jgi:HPr kinase/phosphorylase
MWMLRPYLARALAESTTTHGVLLDVLGVGVLITGDSGAGKSELALELVSRGSGLVADDVVELYRIGPETVEGRCPTLLSDFLEVRGLGVLNIRTIFGEAALRPRKNLKLIVHLERPAGRESQRHERLPPAGIRGGRGRADRQGDDTGRRGAQPRGSD